jgi:excisionase family DNA binding protein
VSNDDERDAHISLQDAGVILGVSDDTVRRRIADGSLPAFRIEGSRLMRVKKSDVMSLLRPVPTVESA